MSSSLVTICQDRLVSNLKESKFNGVVLKELFNYVPDYLLEPIFEKLLETGTITESALLAFLTPSRFKLKINQASGIRKSIFKIIGLNCPNLVSKSFRHIYNLHHILTGGYLFMNIVD